MNQEKIGKFIAECRKENGYTQATLAEKNLIEMTKKEQKVIKVIVAVVIFAVALLIVWFAGQAVGEDLGTFIYNLKH